MALLALTFAGSSSPVAEGAESAGHLDESSREVRHVRTIDSRPNALIVEGTRRSPMIRKLVDRLNRSTVIVYLQSGLLPGGLTGRLSLIGRGQAWRYLRVEIECRQSMLRQIAALGHELQHAVEIADRPTAVDETSIRALYGTIGFAIDGSERRFESDAAQKAGSRVQHELSLRLQTLSSSMK
jgi:hypothetical protein